MAERVRSLDEHPNADEIVGVLAQVVHLDDTATTELARLWRNDPAIAAARARALQPDSPLVLDVLNAFDSITDLYADDLAGEADYLTLPAPVTALGLKAVRDAVAAAYARPALDEGDYERLMAPWRGVFADSPRRMPDFGPQHHEVVELLGTVPTLTCHTHDDSAGERWQTVFTSGLLVDPTAHEAALDSAWQAAVVTRRRRQWRLAVRSAMEGYFRSCARCARTVNDDDRTVVALCLGAVAGTLVRDVLDAESARTLTMPLAGLIPQQRTA